MPIGDPAKARGRLISIRLQNNVLKTPALAGDEEIEETIDCMSFDTSTTTSPNQVYIAFI